MLWSLHSCNNNFLYLEHEYMIEIPSFWIHLFKPESPQTLSLASKGVQRYIMEHMLQPFYVAPVLWMSRHTAAAHFKWLTKHIQPIQYAEKKEKHAHEFFVCCFNPYILFRDTCDPFLHLKAVKKPCTHLFFY